MSARSGAFSTRSAIVACRRGPAIPRRTKRRRRRSKRRLRHCRAATSRHGARQVARSLVSRRGPDRSARHADADVGQTRSQTPRAARSTLHLGLHFRSRLRDAQGHRRARPAAGRRRGDVDASGGNLQGRRARRARRAGSRRRRLSRRRRPRHSRQHHTDPPAALRPPNSTRWRASGPICAPTSSPSACSTTTTISSSDHARHGASSQTIQTASPHANGPRSVFETVGIIPAAFMVDRHAPTPAYRWT